MGAGTDVPYPLSQGVGYGVIVGLGVAFAIGEPKDTLLYSLPSKE